jgi:hypothetical protein
VNHHATPRALKKKNRLSRLDLYTLHSSLFL